MSAPIPEMTKAGAGNMELGSVTPLDDVNGAKNP